MKNKLIGASLFTAVTASLCCITPVLVLIAGTSGMASTFSWIEPFRPYLIGFTMLVLGFAWYQKLIPITIGTKNEIDCECDVADLPAGKAGKPKFIQSKTFLGIVTAFAIIMLAFPFYSGVFYSDTKRQIMVVDKSDMKTIEFKISGMTCESCEEHVDHEVNKLKGIINSKASYKKGNAIIEFDSTKINEVEIEKRINSTGYKVTDKNKDEWKSN
ncbi:mercuric transport protein MerTP [Changchengzhania lutea]|uniref:mercuric transport protein MerTP n=1 Tax=Changchengzhania lutea TaxID=2049305 RepID=UPI00115DBC7E|nr:mercuric transport protein MerTP [Changchengzhania lutea]